MLIGAELAAWLDDGDRQRAGRAAVDAFVDRWKIHPLTMDLRRELKAMAVPTAASVLAAAERMMQRTGDLNELFADLIPAALADPFFRPPLVAVGSDIADGFVLYDDPSVTVSVAVTSADALAAKKSGARGASSIHFTGVSVAFRLIKSGGVTISLWEAPEAGADFVGERRGKCRLVGRRRYEDGEWILLDGRSQSFVIEHVESDMVCLQAAVKVGGGPLTLEYDSRTLDYVGASSADESASRVQIMVSLLRLMGRRDAAPVIADLLDIPSFSARWHIMRELLALDADAALPHLRRFAAEDPHPEVRAAAARTLDMFFAHTVKDAASCHA